MKTKRLIATTALLLGGLMIVPNSRAAAADEPKAAATVSAQSIPVLDLEGTYPEMKPPFDFMKGPGGKSFGELLLDVRRAKDDPKVTALFLDIDSPALGAAQAVELHDELLAFRASGKKIYATFTSAGLKDYMLASTANEIVVPPLGMVALMGMRADLMFFKDTLAKVGIEAEVVNTGKFKTAFEPFTHNTMSEGTRIQISELLGDVFDEVAERVAKGRGVKDATAKRWLEGGPYTASEAYDLGIIDRVAYMEDFRVALGKELGGDVTLNTAYFTDTKKPEAPNLLALLMGGMKPKKNETTAGDKIALVYALGAISDGRAEKSPFSQSEGIYGDDFVDMLDDVAKEPGLKAIVLRVDSPGGSASASDLIWSREQRFRAMGVPIIVSMGNVAGSGGYYIAMGADKIVAEPATITGSIGVIAGRMILGGAYEKIGLHKESISIGENSGLFDESKPWTPHEREIISHMIDDTYDTFTHKAADGRNMKQAQVKRLGGGRVYSGNAAKKLGLIDEVGGVSTAVALARTMGNCPNASISVFPKEKTLFDLIDEVLGGGANASIAAGAARLTDPIVQLEALLPADQRGAFHMLMTSLKSKNPKLMMVMPVGLSLN